MNKTVYCYDKKMKFLCELFPTVDKKTIEETWKENDYNMVKTTDILQETNSPCLSATNSPVLPTGIEEEDIIQRRTSLDEDRSEKLSKETVVLDCKVKRNNSIDISYYIPQILMTETAFIALYDYYEQNTNKYVNSAFCHGKQTAFVHFDHLKQGKYIVKLFLEQNAKETISQVVTIGPEIGLNGIIETKGKKQLLRLSVDNNNHSYWIGIFEHSITCKNNESYLLYSPYTTNKEITFDITSLKPGNYECRVFTKASTEGYFFKKYHSCGSFLFSYLPSNLNH